MVTSNDPKLAAYTAGWNNRSSPNPYTPGTTEYNDFTQGAYDSKQVMEAPEQSQAPEEKMTTIDFDLSLEDWGRVAMIAHEHDMTINQAVIYILKAQIAYLESQRQEENETNADD